MAFEARALLNEADRLERASRGTQRTVSIPVLGFGTAVALLNGAHGEEGRGGGAISRSWSLRDRSSS